MPKDATPNRLVIVNHNFSKSKHKQLAQILEEQWDASSTFKEMGEEYEYSASSFQNVYDRHMGVAESQFNDGIHDERTAGQLKEEYSSMKNYLDSRRKGEIELSSENDTEDDVAEQVRNSDKFQTWREGYEEGHEQGIETGEKIGWNRALKIAKKVGLENVEPMGD